MEVAGDVHYPDPPLTRLVLGRLKGEVITGGGERRYSFVWGCHVVQMGTIDRWHGGGGLVCDEFHRAGDGDVILTMCIRRRCVLYMICE